jgi:two-component system, sensor histidine kinase PdtaS
MPPDPVPEDPAAPPDPEEGRRARLYQRIVRDFGRIALDELEIGPLLRRATAQVSRGTGIRRVKIMRLRKDEGDLLVEAGVGWNPGVVGKARFGIDVGSPAGRAVQTGEPVVVEDLRAQAEFRIHPVLADHGIVSLVNVPVSYGAKCWGVLEADSERPRAFGDVDIAFLETMAALLAGAVQRDEAKAQMAAAAADTAARTERQAMLLRELQHRAKNNLQIVVAMLAQERRAAGEAPSAERFGRVMDRVAAIALAHDRLSDAEAEGAAAGRSATDLAGYLRALLGGLELSLGARIAIEADLDPCHLPFDKAVAVGLIVNELVTNAAKHAYPEGEEGGIVRVALRCEESQAEAELVVSDEGRGMDPTAVAAAGRNERHGQGLGLIRLLARQLGGEVERGAPERGTSTTVRFPLVS